MQNQTSLQETTIKEEAEGLGIEYTNYRCQPHDTILSQVEILNLSTI